MASSIEIIDQDGECIEITTPRTKGLLPIGDVLRMANGWRGDDDPHKTIELLSAALIMALDEGYLSE